MKKFLPYVIEFAKILLCCLFGILLFTDIYHEIGLLPSANGESFQRIDHVYSIYEKLAREGSQALVWFSLALLVISVAVSVLTAIFQKDHEKLTVASYLVFVAAAVLFLLLLFFSASIHYEY